MNIHQKIVVTAGHEDLQNPQNPQNPQKGIFVCFSVQNDSNTLLNY